ncbi:hypothetical protein OAP25_02110 [Flavobacteriaceae bacterium]|nr:hypothetical protein [Flavobacteriaceae bacterium]
MKQVAMIEAVHEDLLLITEYKKTLAPHKSTTIKSVAADLITKEAKRIRKILEKE